MSLLCTWRFRGFRPRFRDEERDPDIEMGRHHIGICESENVWEDEDEIWDPAGRCRIVQMPTSLFMALLFLVQGDLT